MKCCLCDKDIYPQKNEFGDVVWDQGHNAEPVMSGRCCDDCNSSIVIPIRISGLHAKALKDDGKTTR